MNYWGWLEGIQRIPLLQELCHCQSEAEEFHQGEKGQRCRKARRTPLSTGGKKFWALVENEMELIPDQEGQIGGEGDAIGKVIECHRMHHLICSLLAFPSLEFIAFASTWRFIFEFPFPLGVFYDIVCSQRIFRYQCQNILFSDSSTFAVETQWRRNRASPLICPRPQKMRNGLSYKELR